MDKLVNVNIIDNQLTFTVETDSRLSDSILEVYIDEVCDIKNAINGEPVGRTVLTENIVIDSGNNVTVVDDSISELDFNMKYVTLKSYSYQTESATLFHGIYYNPEVIYDAEVRKLNKHCSTCLDDETMQNIMFIVFKRQMLDYALKTDHFEDAMHLYLDLCRLLDISTPCCSNTCNNSCCGCSCILTQNSRCIETEKEKCLHLEKGCSSGVCSIC